MKIPTTLVALAAASVVVAQNTSQSAAPQSDSGARGPTPELVHLYYDEWPTGISLPHVTSYL